VYIDRYEFVLYLCICVIINITLYVYHGLVLCVLMSGVRWVDEKTGKEKEIFEGRVNHII